MYRIRTFSYTGFYVGKRVSILFWIGGFWAQARGTLVPSTERLQLQDLQTGILGVVKGYEQGCSTHVQQGTV